MRQSILKKVILTLTIHIKIQIKNIEEIRKKVISKVCIVILRIVIHAKSKMISVLIDILILFNI